MDEIYRRNRIKGNNVVNMLILKEMHAAQKRVNYLIKVKAMS